MDRGSRPAWADLAWAHDLLTASSPAPSPEEENKALSAAERRSRSIPTSRRSRRAWPRSGQSRQLKRAEAEFDRACAQPGLAGGY